jgi:hypothetical protein
MTSDDSLNDHLYAPNLYNYLSFMKPNTKFIFTVMFQNYIIRKVFATGLRPVGTELGRKFQGKTEHLAASKHCTLQRSEGRSNKTIIFTTYKQRHCVGVSLKVLHINLNLLRKIPVIEEMTVRSEFLPDLTRIMNETKMTLMVKHF